MTHAVDLPAWAALLTAFLRAARRRADADSAPSGRAVRSFFERVHAPTLGTSWGTGAILLASIVFFSVLHSRPVVHEMLIGIFVTVTTPVTLMLLARAALYRDRTEGDANVPPRSLLRSPGGNLPQDGSSDGVR